jgi:adenylosuccinate lyase
MLDLGALSPLDGRYSDIVDELAGIFSEIGLMEHRIIVEGEYLIALSKHPQIGVRLFSDEEESLIRNIHNLLDDDAWIIKAIETEGYKDIKRTNHDVKAVEYYIKNKLADTSLRDCVEWVHFALTSEDVNNLAYGLMLNEAIGLVVDTFLTDIDNAIWRLAINHSETPMLARTHGQPASPTTFGKEFCVYGSRLNRQIDKLRDFELLVKLNGASGNYNAHYAAYPDVNWPEFTTSFIATLNWRFKTNLITNQITTQVEPHDTYAELFDILSRINVILIDFVQDMWRYISDDWIRQKPKESEVGSSAMPHKVNPIDFENAEGNLGLANALFGFFSSKLPISRLQRDLSDSTVERNFGVAFGHCLVAYKSILKGLSKIIINDRKVAEVLDCHPEVIAEAIQTILRRDGVDVPYERLKEFTRGKKIRMDELRMFIDDLDISEEVKSELRRITPHNYIGVAGRLAYDEE